MRGRPLRGLWLAALIGATALYGPAAGRESNLFYKGPPGPHFNGERFFNPDHEQGTGGLQKDSKMQLLKQGLGKGQSHTWPKSVPIQRSRPPAQVDGARMLVTWIGHSSVLVQTRGLNILLDPVWAERSSPVPFAGPRRVRQPGVRLEHLPRIDLILLSHDHYDHLDTNTMRFLWQRDRPVIVTGLGNDQLLSRYGVGAIAADWGQTVPVRPGVDVILRRAHHWSAHSLHDHDKTLWTGFTVTLPDGDLYYAGDTGPGDMQWPTEAKGERPIRLAVLPIGAIKLEDEPPSGNHIGPPEAVTAFTELDAAYALAVHWGTFELTSEPINYPPELLAETLRGLGIPADRFRVLEAGEAWEIPQRR